MCAVFLGTEAALMDEGFASPCEAPAVDPLGAIVVRIRAGEEGAFETLMVQTEHRILALSWRILGDRDLARDAAQETYLRIFRSLASFRAEERFEGWMVRIAVNVCYDLSRKRGPIHAPAECLESVEGDTGSAAAEAKVLLQQRRALIRRALAGLSSAERSALVLRDLEGLSTEEVARILGVRPVTVRSQAASARTKVQAFCARLLKPTNGGRP